LESKEEGKMGEMGRVFDGKVKWVGGRGWWFKCLKVGRRRVGGSVGG
jgi:hypothetical protein